VHHIENERVRDTHLHTQMATDIDPEHDDIQDVISRTSLASLQIGGKSVAELKQQQQRPSKKRKAAGGVASHDDAHDPSLRRIKVRPTDTLEGLAVRYFTTVRAVRWIGCARLRSITRATAASEISTTIRWYLIYVPRYRVGRRD